MQIAVLGAGALGSLFGGYLSADHDVVLVGHDGAHLEAIDNDGLTVVLPDGERRRTEPAATTEHAAVDGADLLLIAVKSYDTAAAIDDVAPYLDGVDVLTVQNGLGNVETIADVAARDSILAGTTTNGAYRDEPGVVVHAGRGETTIGRYWGENDTFVRTVAEEFSAAGFPTEITEDPEGTMWKKVLVNAGINAATALARVPNGRMVTDPSGERLLERAVEEAARVAAAEGLSFESDPVAKTRSVAEATASNRSSMRQDLEAESRTEIDALNGAIVDLADEHGLEVPVNRTLTDCIRLAEGEFLPEAGLR